MGDSFTTGIDLEVEPWSDELAGWLPGARYVSLARPGSRSEEVKAEQLSPALLERPDLVSVICGGNDVITTTRPDLDAFARTFDELLGALRAGLPEATVFTATYPHVAAEGLGPRTRRRIADGLDAVNDEVRSAARRHGVTCFDLAAHPERGNPELFAPDGFHPSPTGHRKAARVFAGGLREDIGIPLEPQEVLS
jgi:lysophospholipase L1-like esterase